MNNVDEELVTVARDLIPTLQERAAEDARNRNVRAETISEIDKAGLYRSLMPKRWGGLETSLSTWFEIMIALGEGDLSVAWTAGIYGGHAYHLARFDERAQQDVWAENRDAKIVSPYAPSGTATPTPDGFRLTGHWKFSSGSTHSDWAALGGIVLGEQPEYRIFLVPREDYEIVDTWRVHGLDATGSHDLRFEDALVPEYRTQGVAEILNGTEPGLKSNDSALYRVPFFQVAMRTLSTGQIGALQAMLDAYTQFDVDRVDAMGQKVSTDGDAQYACAQAVAAIHEMRTLLHDTCRRLESYAESGEQPPMSERLLYRYQSSEVAERCVRCATDLFQAAGGTALFDTAPFGMIHRNLMAGRSHVGNRYREMGRRVGGVQLGLPLDPTDFQL
jgi:3-hydroxy-9,10-secoandrosta-1,3,5(10)-triene-9,17-dione monooxygenase